MADAAASNQRWRTAMLVGPVVAVASVSVGIALYRQYDRYQRRKEHFALLEKAESGDTKAQLQYGDLLLRGNSYITKNTSEGIQWYRR